MVLEVMAQESSARVRVCEMDELHSVSRKVVMVMLGAHCATEARRRVIVWIMASRVSGGDALAYAGDDTEMHDCSVVRLKSLEKIAIAFKTIRNRYRLSIIFEHPLFILTEHFSGDPRPLPTSFVPRMTLRRQRQPLRLVFYSPHTRGGADTDDI